MKRHDMFASRLHLIFCHVLHKQSMSIKCHRANHSKVGMLSNSKYTAKGDIIIYWVTTWLWYDDVLQDNGDWMHTAKFNTAWFYLIQKEKHSTKCQIKAEMKLRLEFVTSMIISIYIPGINYRNGSVNQVRGLWKRIYGKFPIIESIVSMPIEL